MNLQIEIICSDCEEDLKVAIRQEIRYEEGEYRSYLVYRVKKCRCFGEGED